MRTARVHALIGVACLAVAAAAYAQSSAVAVPDNAPVQTAPLEEKPATWGDATAGQSKAGACAACHGLDGNAMLQEAPRIAGMGERYIAEQLALFKHGERTSGLAGVMAPFAMMLSAQDMRDIGAWYATQKPGTGVADDTLVAEGPNKGMKFYQIGERLYRSGDASRNLPAFVEANRQLAERVELSGETAFFYCREPQALLAKLADAEGLRYVHRASNLEDVFIKLTGRELRD